MSLEEEEPVVIRRLPDEDPNSVREVRISCPDATGLGVDLMRVLLDFGLRIIRADISTDGTWCFLVLVVTLSSGVPPRWNLLKSRLQEICPADSEALRNLVRTTSRELQQPFTVHVSGYDRQGMLHALTHSLWEADTSVFKAHVTTDAAGEALDVFWLYDNRNELPQPHRVLEICDRIKGALGPDVKCLVQAAPRTGDPYDSFEGSGHILPRLPCKDALSSRNLRAIVERKAENSGSGTGSGYGSSNDLSASDEPAPLYSPLSPFSAAATADVAVDVDNTTSSSYTMITLRCQDRKGLLYDLFLKLKEVDVRVAYGRVAVDPAEGTSTVELFVQDVGGGRITDEELLRELTGRLRTAAALPVRIEVHDVMSGAATELTVAAPVDAGHRGRPRVTFDVTQGLSSAGVGVYSADVYVKSSQDALSPSSSETQEMHRFLVHRPEGGALSTDEDKRALAEMVRSCLLGTRPAHTLSAQWAMGAEGQGLECKSGLLRSLSSRWKGQL